MAEDKIKDKDKKEGADATPKSGKEAEEKRHKLWGYEDGECTDPNPNGIKKKTSAAKQPKEENEAVPIQDEPVQEEIPERKMGFKGFPHDYRERLKGVPTKTWIRFGLVSVLFFLFVIWVGNPWISIFWLILIDIYLTTYIPWTWWRKKKGVSRTLLSWVDAIVYAFVLVYLIFAFIGQQYMIPSSSLEKSLLVGDFLWVNKTTYGPRVPNTPLHFPFAHHTMPWGGKSYLEWPQLSYHRLPGFREVERGDIVVFNFPEGDTVLTKFPDEDYYRIKQQLITQGFDNPEEYIRKNQATFGDIIVRPVDRKENYVKRVIGLPGERLQLFNDTIFINGKAIANPDKVQFNYIIPVSRTIPDEQWLKIGVRMEDHGSGPVEGNLLTGYKYYTVPLTLEMKKEVEKWPEVSGKLQKENVAGLYEIGNVWPHGNKWNWTRSNTDEFWIPKRGTTLKVTLDNLPLYRRAIEVYENNKLEVKNGRIFINGEENPYYTFKYDYYWMMGDNRDRSLDSRYFGLVPEDHIIGTPQRIMLSFDWERPLFDSEKVRWDRIFSNPNPDKEKAVEKNWKQK